MGFKIEILDKRWDNFLSELNKENLINTTQAISTIKGKILPVWNYTSSSEEKTSPLHLNHVAFKVRDLKGASLAWSKILEREPVIQSREEWDPVSKKKENTDHFYQPFEYYITLIETDEKLCEDHILDHIGFEARDEEALNKARQILKDLDYEIIWEGEICNSQCIHFKGPDSRIHDFFLPSEELKIK